MVARIELKNGVSEEGLKKLVSMDYTTEVVCMEEPGYNGQYFTGKWSIRAVSPDGQNEWVLVTQRKTDSPRIIKTMPGLIKLLHNLGYDGANVPFRAGGRRINKMSSPPSSLGESE